MNNAHYSKQKIGEAASAMMGSGNLLERISSAMLPLLILDESDLSHHHPETLRRWASIQDTLVKGKGGIYLDRLRCMHESEVEQVRSDIVALVWAELYS